MDETTMQEMAKAYHEALKGKTFPKTRPFPDRADETAKTAADASPIAPTVPSAANAPTAADAIANLPVRELAAVEFLLQCAVKSEKTELLIYLRSLLYEVMRRCPAANRTVPTERFLSPETAKRRLSEYAVERLSKTDALPSDPTLYAVDTRILALIPLI